MQDLNKRVLIPAFDLDNENPDASRRSWSPKFFHNFPGPDSDGDRLAYKVALYTSAAPTFFPAVDGFIDGGVFANHEHNIADNDCNCREKHTWEARAHAKPNYINYA